MSPRLAVGKLPPDLLASLLARVPHSDPRVVFGPAVGHDAAVIDMGDHYLVAKSDPITFAAREIGWYAVNVNANDVACMGARPKWFMATVLLPDVSADEDAATNIFDQIVEACSASGVVLVGGHTEITHGLDRPLVIGAMLGEVERDVLVTNAGAQVGDVVLLTKEIPLEGTALIALEKESELSARGLADAARCVRSLLHEPGISVVREALIAAEARLATAMHDPTEGGLATALAELARAAKVGLAIDEEAIPVSQTGSTLCAAYGLDPLGVIASGSLLITTPQNEAARLIRLITDAGVRCNAIGRVVSAREGLTLNRAGKSRPLPEFQADEIARLFH